MAYRDLVIAHGASHYWKLDETTGTVAVDQIGGSANGTISGGVTLGQPTGVTGGGTAMRFDGVAGTVRATTVTIPLAATIELWFTRTLIPDGVLLSSRGTGSSGNVIYVGFQAGSLMIFSTAVSVGVKFFPNDGVWHHVVIVLTGTTATFYTDGVQDGPATAQTRTTPSTGPFDFARDDPNNSNFNGSLDEVAIYPLALTPTQIAAHFAAGKAGWPGVPWWLDPDEDGMNNPANLWEPITPSDATDLKRGLTLGLWVGGGGDVAAVMQNGVMPVVLAAVPAGAWLPLAAKRINATGTTATGLVALYRT